MAKKRGRGTRTNGQGSLLQRKGTNIWYCQFYKNGRQVRVSSGTEIKAKAETVLRRLMGDSERGLPLITDIDKITYADLRKTLLANYVEKGNRSLWMLSNGEEMVGGLKLLDSYFGYDGTNPGWKLSRITTDAARDFAAKQLADGYAAATVNRALSALKRMLALARQDGKVQSVPYIHMLHEPPARKGFVTIENFQKLLNALPVHLQPVVLFLYWCGGRKGEARKITWEQVDLQRGLIRLEAEQTKTEEARIVPLPPVLIKILQKKEPKPGEPRTGLVFDCTDLRNEWGRACDAVGLGTRTKETSESGFIWYRYSGLMLHDLRRSAVRNLVNAGVPERVAMRISGHKTRSIFDRYHIVTTADVTTAMQRLVAASKQKRLSAKLVQSEGVDSRKLLRARSSIG